eukprot:15977747-Heterocapsa_arctica.AAC.2
MASRPTEPEHPMRTLCRRNKRACATSDHAAKIAKLAAEFADGGLAGTAIIGMFFQDLGF